MTFRNVAFIPRKEITVLKDVSFIIILDKRLLLLVQVEQKIDDRFFITVSHIESGEILIDGKKY
jgi:hypothetical protein